MNGSIVILVPAYRCEKTIAATLASIQEQGTALKRVSAVIVADDGSRDDTAKVAREAWKCDVPLEILQREYNCGEYASVNNAVAQFPAETEWFLIMHADNAAKPGWLAALVERIDAAREDVGLIGSSYDTWLEDGRTIPGENRRGEVTVRGNQEAVAGTLVAGCWWHISSCAIRVRAYRDVGGLPKAMQLKGDWDFMLRILANGWTIEHLPRSYMLYRENEQGSSSLTFRRHMDVGETMAVLGRFHLTLTVRQLLRIHLRQCGYIVRRMAGAVVRRDLMRLVWALPALGVIQASFWTCFTDSKRWRRS